MTDFTVISKGYEKDSIVQKSAGERVFDLLAIRENDDVLDLGCGTGHITGQIKAQTHGLVVGVDAAPGMVEKATEKFAASGCVFRNLPAENLDYQERFDKIYCNSAFQWFKDPRPVLAGCHAALKTGGRMAIQAPARHDYCPNFLLAVDSVAKDPETAKTFAGFNSPWFFLNEATDYRALFEKAGFTVLESFIERVATRHSTEEAVRIFESGAAAGYLNQVFYSAPLPTGYADAFRRIVRDNFTVQANQEGVIDLIFHRIFLLAEKQDKSAGRSGYRV